MATRNFPVGAISELIEGCANDNRGIAVAVNKTANNEMRLVARLLVGVFAVTGMSCSVYLFPWQ